MLTILIEGLILLTLEPVGAPQELWALFVNPPSAVCRNDSGRQICGPIAPHLATLTYTKNGQQVVHDLAGKHIELVGDSLGPPLNKVQGAVEVNDVPPAGGSEDDYGWVLSMSETNQLPYPRVLKPQLLTTPSPDLLQARLRLTAGTLRTDSFERVEGTGPEEQRPFTQYRLEDGDVRAVADRVAVVLQVSNPKLRISSIPYLPAEMGRERPPLAGGHDPARLAAYAQRKRSLFEEVDLAGVTELTFSNHPLSDRQPGDGQHFLAFYRLFYPDDDSALAQLERSDGTDGSGLCGPFNQP